MSLLLWRIIELRMIYDCALRIGCTRGQGVKGQGVKGSRVKGVQEVKGRGSFRRLRSDIS